MKNIVGTTFQHYQVLAKVRETATRVLYKVYDTQTLQNAALEIIKIRVKDNNSLLKALNEQSIKSASLSHPNIAQMIDSGIHDGSIYLVYNFSPAHPLRRFFNRAYGWHEMARELVSIAQALAHAHEKGVNHGSLNPSSIMLSEKRVPYLFGLGLEQVITEHILSQAPGAWVNKWGIEYRAPEQLIGNPPDWRSDIYSMGVILYEWLTGKIAFRESTIFDTLKKRVASSSQELKPEKEISPAILTMIEKCLATNPNDRYQSMQEVGLILARGALDLTITRKMARKPLEASNETSPRRFNLILSLMLIAIVVTGLFMTQASRFSQANDEITATLTTTRTAPPLTKPTTATPQTTVSTPTLPSPPTEKVVVAPSGVGNSKFPLFQATPMEPSGPDLITINNGGRVLPLSVWGMGDFDNLAISSDGKQLAAATSIGIFIFGAQDLSFQRYIDTLSHVTTVDYQPGNHIVAAGDDSGLIQLWDTDTGDEIGKPYSRHTNTILDLDFSPDGTQLASVSLDGSLIQWDVSSGRQSQTQVQTTTVMNCVTYSSDGKKVITGDNLFVVNIFDTEDLIIEKTFTASFRVVDLAVFPNSSIIVIADGNRNLSVLDTESIGGENKGTAEPMGAMQFRIMQISISPDGKLVAGGDINGGITVWTRNEKGEWVEKWKITGDTVGNDEAAPGKIHSIAFSPDGKSIFSGVRNGIVRSFDANSKSNINENRTLDTHTERLAVSPNGGYALVQYRNEMVKLWDIWNGIVLQELQGRLVDGGSFSSDGKYFAIASGSSAVKLYEPSSNREVFIFNNNGDIRTIQFISDNTQLVAGRQKGIHLWSLISGQEMVTKGNVESGCDVIQDVNFNDLFRITEFHHVIMNTQNSVQLCRFNRQSTMKALFVNEESERIVYGGDNLLVVQATSSDQKWDMQSGVNGNSVISVTVNRTGSLLAAAYTDHTIHLWDISNQRELAILNGHKNTITDLQFVPDGNLLISTSLDGTIRLWGIPYQGS